MLEILEAIIKLGLPVMLMSWFFLRPLYRQGALNREDTRKSTAESLKRIRRDHKEKKSSPNYVHSQWMRFGGGFYGIAALWTFLIIEISDLGSFLMDFSGFDALFERGLVNFLVSILLNQVENFVAAMIWFSYWGDSQGASVIVWAVTAYVGYLAGMTAAKRGE